MGRSIVLIAILAAGLSACVPGNRITDPSPQATLSDDLNEPTDGFANEIGAR